MALLIIERETIKAFADLPNLQKPVFSFHLYFFK